MDTIKKKKNIKAASVCSASVVLGFFSLVLVWDLLCFCTSFLSPCSVFCLYIVWFLSSASAFVILHPELQLALCACLIHSIGEEREKKRLEMGHALFLSSLVSNAFPRKILSKQ